MDGKVKERNKRCQQYSQVHEKKDEMKPDWPVAP